MFSNYFHSVHIWAKIFTYCTVLYYSTIDLFYWKTMSLYSLTVSFNWPPGFVRFSSKGSLTTHLLRNNMGKVKYFSLKDPSFGKYFFWSSLFIFIGVGCDNKQAFLKSYLSIFIDPSFVMSHSFPSVLVKSSPGRGERGVHAGPGWGGGGAGDPRPHHATQGRVAAPFSFEFVDWYVSVFWIGIRLLFQMHLKFLNSSWMGFFSRLIFSV